MSNNQALRDAAKHGDVVTVENLLNGKADIESGSRAGSTQECCWKESGPLSCVFVAIRRVSREPRGRLGTERGAVTR